MAAARRAAVEVHGRPVPATVAQRIRSGLLIDLDAIVVVAHSENEQAGCHRSGILRHHGGIRVATFAADGAPRPLLFCDLVVGLEAWRPSSCSRPEESRDVSPEHVTSRGDTARL
jgi:hypothetical protein